MILVVDSLAIFVNMLTYLFFFLKTNDCYLYYIVQSTSHYFFSVRQIDIEVVSFMVPDRLHGIQKFPSALIHPKVDPIQVLSV